MQLLSAVLFCLFLGLALVSFRRSFRHSHHLKMLRSSAERIAAGDLSAPVSAATPPTRELADLQEAFAKMASSLRDTRESLDRQMEQERTMNDALQSLQRQLVRQERLAAVGVLASGIAHELNNPLQAIVGATQLLERNPSLDRDARGEVDFVKIQSDRAVSVIRSLSRFGIRHQSVPVAPLPVEDRRIEIKRHDIGRWVRFEVCDNGLGVPAEDEAKLFQPFFTTKSVGQGTGLGLSVSYGIVQSLGGTIGYFRNDWGGATFFVELPCADDDSVTNAPAAVLRRLV